MFKKINYLTFINLFFIVVCTVFFLLPFLLVISISFTDEEALRQGFSLIPEKFSLQGYQYVFKRPGKIIDAYIVTSFQAFGGAFLSIFVMSLCAYPLSRTSFRLRKPITFYIFFTMLFGGGLVPSYILNAQYLHLKDSVWVYILPSLATAWYIIIMRTFFQGIPISLIESAKIDGASEYRIYFQFILPLSKPVLAAVSLLILLDKWNTWFTTLIYISDEKLYLLQYFLQKLLMDLDFMKNLAAEGLSSSVIESIYLPTESMRFALCVVAAGPMVFVFPFFQKHFTKGLTVGSVKG